MTRYGITGASGFIGAHLVQRLRAEAAEVLAPLAAEWRLGAPLPKELLEVDVLIHLACATAAASAHRGEMAALDLRGTEILLEQIRQRRKLGHRVRFIFISSQSAQAEAGNDYGRSKYAIETMLTEEDEIVVRPGLVYGGRGRGVFGVLEKLSRLPVMPILTRTPCIQPISAAELAEALCRISAAPAPARRYCLGAPQALTLAQAVRAAARRRGGRPPFCLPFPAWPVRLLGRLADRLLGLPSSLSERIDGLLTLQPMSTSESLAALNLSLADFSKEN